MFKIRTLTAAALAALLLPAAALAGIGSYTTNGAWSFVSAPKLHPPKLATPVKRGSVGGEFLVTNSPGNPRFKMVGTGGPLILDSHLQPVWVAPISTNVVSGNLKEQTYAGKPVLTWWQGVVNGHGITSSGEDVVVDQHYKQLATLKGADGWVLSEHDMVISGHDAWVTAYRNVAHAPGAPANVTVFDAAVQQYDLTTGKLLYTWDALQHIPLSDSYQPAPKSGVWDAYHENAIQLVSGNRFLVSMRQEWAAYLVSATTGGIEWQLGGKHSTFKFGRGAQFEWQHDVQLHGNQVSMFDDHCCGLTSAGKVMAGYGPARALVLNLSTAHHTATVATQIVRARNFYAQFLGSVQMLSHGNLLVSWGSTRYFSVYGKNGKLLLDMRWPGNGVFPSNETYRTYLTNWSGTPGYPPSGAVRTSKGKTSVYASWNGATGVTAWRVLGGSSASHLTVIVRKANRSGFETAIKLPKGYGTYEVQALNGRGAVIGSSKPFTAGKAGGGSPNPNNQFYT
jgi:Arylsulfotransferase (ASST)